MKTSHLAALALALSGFAPESRGLERRRVSDPCRERHRQKGELWTTL